MKLLVAGADGQVGSQLRRSLTILGDVVALDREACDLAYPEQIAAIVRALRPDIILNAAAYTAVDQAESDEATATTVNGAAVGILATEARTSGALLVHYSTDYVFDGEKTTPYVETDQPRPLNAYGRSKLAGEIAITKAGGAYLILRTSWVYSAHGRNFVRTMLDLAKTRKALQIVNDQHGAPTSAQQIADATAQILRKACDERAQGRFTSGLFHLAASGETTWFEFAARIFALAQRDGMLAGSPPELTPVSSREFPRPAARPKNSRLSCVKLRERYGVTVPDWKDALAACLKDIKTTA